MNYTIEQFQIDIEEATNTDAKSEILIKAIGELDASNPEVKEIILQYKNELKDYKEQLVDEEDALCKMFIEGGEYELYTCKKDMTDFGLQENEPYYIKIDDVGKVYEASITAENPIIKEYISKIEPIVYIIVDDGIGSKKRRTNYMKSLLNFEENFEKV